MVIRHDEYNVFLDYGVAHTYEWEQCYEEGFITEAQYEECKKIQKELDNKPF